MEDPFHAAGDQPGLKLIETFAADAPADTVSLHLARMQRSAEILGWGFDPDAARAVFAEHLRKPLGLRLTLDAAGEFELTQRPLPPMGQTWRVQVAGQRLDSSDPWLRIKSTHRPIHDAVRAALPEGVDEAILVNERGEVCEGTITTLFFGDGFELATPPLSSGLLPGIMREEMIEAGVREDELHVDELADYELWIGNSMRGLMKVELV